jgi:Flp pilus assembly pilin Flp
MYLTRCPSPSQRGTSFLRASWRRLFRPKKRRGATMMEYLVCLSFIIAVLVIAIQHFGGVSGNLFTKDAQAVPTSP